VHLGAFVAELMAESGSYQLEREAALFFSGRSGHRERTSSSLSFWFCASKPRSKTKVRKRKMTRFKTSLFVLLVLKFDVIWMEKKAGRIF
jgi:hypothetical protein